MNLQNDILQKGYLLGSSWRFSSHIQTGNKNEII